MTETYQVEGLKYTSSNYRMCYHPDFHENHGKPWTINELQYLCSSWDGMKKADIALALGRTHGTVLSKAHQLKKSGEFEKFKEMRRRKV